MVTLLKKYAKGRICAIGDGGNDVSMIQAAHVGVGIQGKVKLLSFNLINLFKTYELNKKKKNNLFKRKVFRRLWQLTFQSPSLVMSLD